MTMSEAGVFRILRTRYPEASCALLPQVADRTGSPTRHADAIAMQLWPSRGLTIEGIEIKTARSDWLRELAAPEKADVIFRFCDKWWLCAPAGVAKLEEIPSTWGWLMPVESQGAWVIDVAKQAPENKTVIEPTRTFLASLLRSLQRDATDEKEIKKAIDSAVAAALKAAKVSELEREKRRMESIVEDFEALKKNVRDFEAASGLRIGNRWDASHIRVIGDAARAVVEGKGLVQSTLQAMKQLRNTSQYTATRAEEMIEALTKVDKDPSAT